MLNSFANLHTCSCNVLLENENENENEINKCQGNDAKITALTDIYILI